MNAAKRAEIFARLAQANPAPKSELEFSTPYELLVAVILSAQATDKSVNLATRKLFPVANTPQAIAALGIERLEEYIRTIGLFHTKAKNVVEMSRLLVEKFGGEVPRTRDALEALPGVGRKTANVVLNTAFGQETFAVDTHIFRVCNRTKLAPGNTPRDVEAGLEKFVPPTYRLHAHHWLILHGRYTCIARKPACPRCVIRDLCEYRDKTSAEETARARAGQPGAKRGAPVVAKEGNARPLAAAAKTGGARAPVAAGTRTEAPAVARTPRATRRRTKLLRRG
jgi:endonuclease-3